MVDAFTRTIASVGTSAAPSWVVDGSRTLLAWKGQGQDSGIYYTTTDSLKPNAASHAYNWAAQTAIAGVGTSAAPALANLGGAIYLAWKGEGSDTGIYWSRWQGEGGAWSAQVKIPGIGGTSAAPALAAYGGVLWLAWREAGGGSGIFWSKSSDGGQNWSAQMSVGNVGTSDGPALAVDAHGHVHLMWKGEGSDGSLYWSMCSDGVSWAAQQKGPSGALSGPSIFVDKAGGLCAVWCGVTPGQTIGAEPSIQVQMVYYSARVDDPAQNRWSIANFHITAGTTCRPALISTGPGSPDLMIAWSSPGANQIFDLVYGPLNLAPMKLLFDIPVLDVKMMRSGTPLFGKSSTDTVYVSSGVMVKGKPLVRQTKFVGELSGGMYGVDLSIGPIEVFDADIVFMHYAALNSSAGLGAADKFLGQAATQIFDALEKADMKALEKFTGLPFSALPAQAQQAVLGAQLTSALGLADIVIPELGVIIGALAGWFATDIWGAFCPKCDGPVAFAAYIFSGAQIRNAMLCAPLGVEFLGLAPVGGIFSELDDNPGVNSPSGCGENSHYQVTWTIRDQG